MKKGKTGRFSGWTRSEKALVMAIFLLSAVVCKTETGRALEFDVGSGVHMDWDTTASYAAAWRVEDQNKKLLSKMNGDDGDRSFKQWDMINNRFKLLSEADMQYRNIGLFIRGKAFYDFVYMGESAHDSPSTHNNAAFYGGPLDDHQEFTHEAQQRHGKEAELLDIFLYGNFDAKGHNLVVRIGRQVVSWGESLFIQNSISSAQSPVDATELNVPGVELKDVFLPVGQVYSQIDIVNNLTLAAYYQWEWDETRMDEAGTYFSTTDFLDRAGNNILVQPGLPASIDRVRDDDPDNSGQWGMAVRYKLEALNETELGLYYINYHEKLFQVITQPGGGTLNADWFSMPLPRSVAAKLAFADSSSYFLRYAENVRLLGFSVGTVLGDTNVAGEVSYRQDFPVAIKDPGNLLSGIGYEEASVFQSQISLIHILGPSFFSDNTTFTAEAGFNKIYGISGSKLNNDDFAWGYIAKIALDYFSILPGMDLNVPITFKHNVEGVSPVTGTFAEDQNSIAIGMDYTYRFVWKFGIGYTAFIGDSTDDPKSDRDYLSFNIKRTF